MTITNPGIQFLLNQYPNNVSHDDFRLNLLRRVNAGLKLYSNRREEAEAFLEGLNRTHLSHSNDPEILEKLRRYYHGIHVIQELPDSYIETQRRLTREQGHGNIEITDDLKAQLLDIVTSDQKSSLDNWMEYLTSPDTSNYPMWIKYWIFNSVVRLSTYDNEKQTFGERSKKTTTPFPELNREALAKVVDTALKLVESNSNKPEQSNSNKPEQLSFNKLYADELSKITKIKDDDLKNTAGKWIKYPQGSDHMKLVKALQGKNTGWCTVAESTAKVHLTGGDFYVYYSYDSQEELTIPRVAIRMEGGNIAEVRGRAKDQNLDSYISDVVDEKLKEFPDGEKYKKKARDMKMLTSLAKKREDLTIEELRFLYEIDSKIEGFGYQRDPRIEEIRKGRDIKEDLAKIFNCREEEIALNERELNNNTTIVYGYLDPRNVRNTMLLPEGLTYLGAGLDLRDIQNTTLPKGLTHIAGSLDLRFSRDSQITTLPEGLTHIGGNLYLRDSQITTLPENIKEIVKGRIID